MPPPQSPIGSKSEQASQSTVQMSTDALKTRAQTALAELQHGTYDAAQIDELANALFEAGIFPAVGPILEELAQAGHLTARGASTLAALRHMADDYEGSRIAVQTYAAMRPFRLPPTHDGQRPLLMRMRAVHGSHMRAAEDTRSGRFTRQLQRGHFSTRALIPSGEYDIATATIGRAGIPDASKVPAPDLIVKCAACADLNAPGLRDVQTLLARWPGVPIVNPPEKVLRTTRAANALRLGTIEGVRFPRTLNFRCLPDLAGTLDLLEKSGLSYPLILRRAGSQTGVSMGLVVDRASAAGYLAAEQLDARMIAIEFNGTISPGKLYRKLRVFFIDGVLFPVVDLRSDHWNIHSGDRYRVMVDRPDLKERELAFLHDPTDVLGQDRIDMLHAIARVIDLDFFGVDFTPEDRGGITVFEANAAMRHNYEHLASFPYRKPFLDAISNGFAAMLRRRIDPRAG